MDAENSGNVITAYNLSGEQFDRSPIFIRNLTEVMQEHKNAVLKPHTHNFYQVIWFKKGEGHHYVDFKKYKIRNNTLLLISNNQVHRFDKTDYKGVLFGFPEGFLVQNGSKIELAIKFNLFKQLYQVPVCYPEQEAVKILEDLSFKIKEELEKPNTFGKMDLLAFYLKAFLIHIQRCKDESSSIKGVMHPILEKDQNRFAQFNALLESNYKSRLKVTDYAGLLFISPRTLSALTKKMINKSPSQIINERVILEAKRLLAHTDLSVKEIGYNLGFEDSSYFTKFFTKHTRQRPIEFKMSFA